MRCRVRGRLWLDIIGKICLDCNMLNLLDCSSLIIWHLDVLVWEKKVLPLSFVVVVFKGRMSNRTHSPVNLVVRLSRYTGFCDMAWFVKITSKFMWGKRKHEPYCIKYRFSCSMICIDQYQVLNNTIYSEEEYEKFHMT